MHTKVCMHGLRIVLIAKCYQVKKCYVLGKTLIKLFLMLV